MKTKSRNWLTLNCFGSCNPITALKDRENIRNYREIKPNPKILVEKIRYMSTFMNWNITK